MKIETRGRKKLTEEQKLKKLELKKIIKEERKLKKGSIKDIEYNPWSYNEYAPGYVIDENGKEVKLICF